MMKRNIIMIIMILGIYQTLCTSSYSCEPTSIQWEQTYVDGKPVYFNKEVVVRPGQNILFKVSIRSAAWEFRKVNFRFTNIESQEEASYEENDKSNINNISQVGIHWKVDGKIVTPGRYLIEVQAPYRNPTFQRCSESSNILRRHVVFDASNATEESEVEDE